MSIKDKINEKLVVDGLEYPFNSDIRIKINQFYKLDTAERLRILLLAETVDKELEKTNKKIDAIDVTKFAKLDEENTFTKKMNANGGVSFENKEIVSVDKAGSGQLNIGNSNLLLNLIGSGRIHYNGAELKTGGSGTSGDKFEVLFKGKKVIQITSNTLNGANPLFDYSDLVKNKDYNFIVFTTKAQAGGLVKGNVSIVLKDCVDFLYFYPSNRIYDVSKGAIINDETKTIKVSIPNNGLRAGDEFEITQIAIF